MNASLISATFLYPGYQMDTPQDKGVISTGDGFGILENDASSLPDKVDQSWCDSLILQAYDIS